MHPGLLLLAVTLLVAGCGAAGGPPTVAVAPAAPELAPQKAEPSVKPPVPPAQQACTAPGAQFRDAKVAPKPFTPTQEQQFAQIEAYIRDHAYPTDAPSKAQLAEYAYTRARLFFEANRWAEAAVAFREVAADHADSEVGIYALMLYLESLNVLGSKAEPGRTSCYDQMARDVPVFLDLYCTGARAKQNAEQCTLLGKVQRDIERLRIESIVKRADRDEAGAAGLYEEAGAAYLALARRCVEEARGAGASPQGNRCDEIAYNAGRAFLAAKLIDRAREAEAVLTDPRNRLEKSPLTEKLVKALRDRAAGP